MLSAISLKNGFVSVSTESPTVPLVFGSATESAGVPTRAQPPGRAASRVPIKQRQGALFRFLRKSDSICFHLCDLTLTRQMFAQEFGKRLDMVDFPFVIPVYFLEAAVLLRSDDDIQRQLSGSEFLAQERAVLLRRRGRVRLRRYPIRVELDQSILT